MEKNSGTPLKNLTAGTQKMKVWNVWKMIFLFQSGGHFQVPSIGRLRSITDVPPSAAVDCSVHALGLAKHKPDEADFILLMEDIRLL